MVCATGLNTCDYLFCLFQPRSSPASAQSTCIETPSKELGSEQSQVTKAAVKKSDHHFIPSIINTHFMRNKHITAITKYLNMKAWNPYAIITDNTKEDIPEWERHTLILTQTAHLQCTFQTTALKNPSENKWQTLGSAWSIWPQRYHCHAPCTSIYPMLCICSVMNRGF